MLDDVGKKIKQLRNKKKLTLKDLSGKTNLSIGFLSQLERGLTTIAIDSLNNIAKELDVNLTYFIPSTKHKSKVILRSYEKEVFQVDNNQFIHYHLTNDVQNKNLLPRLMEILPTTSTENITSYSHSGEEFIYILEGILTLFIDDEPNEMYPQDSAHYDSNILHNWANYTNRKVKLLVVHTPNVFKEEKKL